MDPRLSLPEVIAHAQRVERLGYDGLHVAETVHDAMAVALLAAEHTVAHHGADERGPGVHSQPDAAGVRGVGHRQAQRRPVPARPRARRSARTSRTATACRSVTTRSAGCATTSARCAPRSIVRVRPGAVLRERALPGDSTAAVLQPGARPGHRRADRLPRRRAAARLRAGRGGGRRLREPPDQFQSRAICRRRACRRWPRAPGRRGGTSGRTVSRRWSGTSVITGATAEAVDRERERQRRLLAFLYSTPAYAPTLELYGWDDLGPRLRDLIRRERWDDLGAVLSDEVLDTLVPSGSFDELAEVLLAALRRAGPGDHGVGPGGRGRRRAIRRRRGRVAGGLTDRARQRGIGKMSSSLAMASTAAIRASSRIGA